MKKDPEDDALREYFENQIEKFGQYFNDAEEYPKIFMELGFDEGCDGFCPECKQKLLCGIYEEDKWDWFYS